MTSAPDPDLSFMSAFPAPTQEAWRAAVDKVLKGGDFEKRLVAKTADGIRVEPLYLAASPPARPLRAQAGRWQVTARLDHPEPAEDPALEHEHHPATEFSLGEEGAVGRDDDASTG